MKYQLISHLDCFNQSTYPRPTISSINIHNYSIQKGHDPTSIALKCQLSPNSLPRPSLLRLRLERRLPTQSEVWAVPKAGLSTRGLNPYEWIRRCAWQPFSLNWTGWEMESSQFEGGSRRKSREGAASVASIEGCSRETRTADKWTAVRIRGRISLDGHWPGCRCRLESQ